MTLPTEQQFDIHTMQEIAALAHEVSSGKPMSAEEMNRRVAAIAEEVWAYGSVVFEQLYQHVERRPEGSHPVRTSYAYLALMRFRRRAD